MNFIDKVITFVIAITLIPTIVESVDGLTGVGMALEGTSAGTLLGLAPLLFVAAVIVMFYRKTRG